MMPSGTYKTGHGRSFNNYRVKVGNKCVFDSAKRADCLDFMRKNKDLGKMKLLSPNRPKA
jgi:hypothetical protein